ncbi:MAG: hypothetical protein J5822_06770 [Eubacteriaceae bacterium]|nr:hypothetical protein [Eubacteriaceae bacterium]
MSEIALYNDGKTVIRRTDEGLLMVFEDGTFRIGSSRYEPCLYLEGREGTAVTIHNSFTEEELTQLLENCGTINMITGNSYDAKGIVMLLSEALMLNGDSFDIGYLEGRCFMELLRDAGAVSPDTAAGTDISEYIVRPEMLRPLIHSKHIAVTEDGRYYLLKPQLL